MSYLIRLVLLLLMVSGVRVYAQEADERTFYESENGDLSLAYPNTWELDETDSSITLSYESYTLSLLRGDLRIGLPAGDFERRKLIGPYAIPVDVLIYNGQTKQVLYGRLEGPEISLAIVLDGSQGQETTYEDIAIPLAVIEEANQIVSSLRLTAVQQPADITVVPFFSGEHNPIDAWQTFSHPTEPFAFRYPSTWMLEEEPTHIILSRDGVRFVIAYNSINAQPPLVNSELWNNSDQESRMSIFGLHQAIPSWVVEPEADGTAAGVIYAPIMTPDNHFVMWVSTETRLDTSTIDEVDLIISTFKTRLPSQVPASQ